MTDTSVNTTQLHKWLDRMRGGDRDARDELLRALGNRLERLARRMLQRFPGVHRLAETDDVLQNALLRLLRALEHVQPGSVRDFFGLAAEQMRRELLDMARHFYGPQGLVTHCGNHDLGETSPATVADSRDPDDLERWTAFHEGVANLPTKEREVVGLIFYHGWTQQEVAELLHINERTVRRWWESALLKLRGTIGGSES